LFDERAEPGREALWIDEVDEMPVTRPLLDLGIRQAAEPPALAVGGRRPNTARHGIWIRAALSSIHACSSAGSVSST
jgi:hypothetical protein